MSDDVYLIDGNVVFTNALLGLMQELSIDEQHYTKEELNSFIRLATSQANVCWDDFIIQTIYGNDPRVKLRNLLNIGKRFGKRKFYV